MKTKVLRDQPMSFIEALENLRQGNCDGIMPVHHDFLYLYQREEKLYWSDSGNYAFYIANLLGKWCLVIEAPKTAMVEVTEEEAEEMAKFFQYAESEPVRILAEKLTKAFKD